MSTRFDPDALLAALPRRRVRPLAGTAIVRATRARPIPDCSALDEPGQYNGFSSRERDRIAVLSNWLCRMGNVDRPTPCDLCGGKADDEHAENYYDIESWIGLCIRCHRNILHGRFARPARWQELLDRCEIPDAHWARLIADQPFDLAALLRSRGVFEPTKAAFTASAREQSAVEL